MNSIEKQFVPYKLALKLKELGFDEKCFNVYDELGFIQDEKEMDKLNLIKLNAPLWQQAFDWLLPKLPNYNLDQMENTFDLRYYDGKEWSYIIMMGTRQACLEKLIEIIKP